MIGDAANRGIIPRAIAKIFAAKREIEQRRVGRASVNVTVELLEVTSKNALRSCLILEERQPNSMSVASPDLQRGGP